MSDQDLGSVESRSVRHGAAWKTVSWIAAVAGVTSVAMTLAQGLIALAGIPKGTFWTVLIAVTSPGLPIAALGLLFGALGWFSAYRRRAMIGIVGCVVTAVAFVILEVTIGRH